MPIPMPTATQIEAYLCHLAQDRSLAPATIQGYRGELTLLVRLGVRLERQALARHIGQAVDGPELSPTSRNRRLVIIRAFCQYLVAQGQLAQDPTEGIARARVPRKVTFAPSATDLRAALAAIPPSSHGWLRARDQAILVLLFHTGLRVGELQRLNLDQVDLPHKVLRAVRRKGAHQVDVPLNPEATAVLCAYLGLRPSSPDPAVFLNQYGQRLSVRMIQRRLRELGTAAQVKLHPHAVRHAHATALLGAGTPVEVIRQSLNHASIATTQRYLHGDEAGLRAALNQLPELRPPPLPDPPSPLRTSPE